jgi:hypothetical protein
MDIAEKSVGGKSTRMKYEVPAMKKHDPVKIVQGSWDCWALYYSTLYYYY